MWAAHLLPALILCSLSFQGPSYVGAHSTQFTCEADGKFPDNENPQLYFICTNGVVSEGHCESGESFDFNPQQCAPYGSKGECVDQPEGALIPHDDDHRFYKCSHQVAYQITCVANLVFNPAVNVCDWDKELHPEYNVCEGMPNCLIPDNADPTRYYRCTDGHRISLACPSGKSFDPTNKTCVDLNYDICTDEAEGDMVPHTDENRFYKCSHGVGYQITCWEPLVFKYGRCNWASAEELPTVVYLGPCHGQEDGALVANSADPKAYFLCFNGTSQSQTCLSGSSFDTNSQSCVAFGTSCVDKADGTFLPHATNPTKFYICDHNIAYEKSCLRGLVFNPAKSVCDWPSAG
uniref:peritrophin-48-like n=1 Tax=Myxine glutinosa TaxID=7769 RepID=UPI00358E75F0